MGDEALTIDSKIIPEIGKGKEEKVKLGHSVIAQADEEEAMPFPYLDFALSCFLQHKVHPIFIVQAVPLQIA